MKNTCFKSLLFVVVSVLCTFCVLIFISFIYDAPSLTIIGFDEVGYVVEDRFKLREGAGSSIISLDDFWSVQSSFYQTVIAVLIAANATLATAAFFVVRAASLDKAREEAQGAVKEKFDVYLNSQEFHDMVNGIVADRVRSAQIDYVALSDWLQATEERVKDVKDDLDILIDNFSRMDVGESEGEEFRLER